MIFTEKGKVVDIQLSQRTPTKSDEFFLQESGEMPRYIEERKIDVQVLTGEDKGEIVNVSGDIHGNPYDIKVEEGDEVLLYGQKDSNGEAIYSIQDFWHLDALLLWIGVFLVSVLILGGKKGLKAILSLGVSLLIIFGVLIPSLKAGYNPLLMTFLIASSVTVIAILILSGFTKKALRAIIGTIGGVIVAIIFVLIIGYATRLTGLGSEETRMLAANFTDFNYKGLLFAGIVIGALGAVMDVAVSISSGLEEIKEHKPNVSSKELVKSGMNIGRDILGSMLNTLIFAYVGASLAMILLFSELGTNLMEILNYDFIAEEIVRSLVGSLGLVATIPITALSVGLMRKK